VRPDVARRTDGTFFVAWASGPFAGLDAYYGGSSDGDGSGIFARDFDLADEPEGRERPVNGTVPGEQRYPDLAFGDTGKVAIVWESQGEEGREVDRIVARVFDVITPACGDADEDGDGSASDALFVLQAAVGSRSCAACLCDVNDSGTQTAADALIVLRDALGAEAALSCPACEQPAVAFGLESDVPCWGAHVEIGAGAVPAGAAESCKAEPSLALLGCTASFSSDAGALVFDARGCFLTDTDLFSCSVSPQEAAAMAAASTTACGCGCAETCPTTPVLCAQTEGEPACAAPAAVEAFANPVSTAFASVNVGQATVTSSTTCETCCDFSDDATVSLESDVVVTELLVRFSSGRDLSCFEDVSCDAVSLSAGPAFARFEADGDTVALCISDPVGIDGPVSLGSCDVSTGSITHGPAEVVRALGANLEPIDPKPSVVLGD
jgi:hypothetical protein